MENGFSTSDAVLTAAMSGNGFGGNRGGQWGGSGYGYNTGDQVLAAEAHANGTAVDAKVESIQDGQRLAFDSLQEQIRESRNLDQFSRVSDNQFRSEIRSSDQHAGLLKSASDAEFRSLDRQRDIERVIAQNAKDAAECCCETQKLILSEGNETRSLILAVEGRANLSALAAAQAKITQLETINALSHNHRG